MIREALDAIEEKEDEKRYEEMILKKSSNNNSVVGNNNQIGNGHKGGHNKGENSLGGSFINSVSKKNKEEGSPEKSHHRVAS